MTQSQGTVGLEYCITKGTKVILHDGLHSGSWNSAYTKPSKSSPAQYFYYKDKPQWSSFFVVPQTQK